MESYAFTLGVFGLTVLSWLIVWHYLLRGVTALHADSPAMQGLANLT